MTESIYSVETDFGSFLVKQSASGLAIGGTKFCVNINIFNNDAELYWLGTSGGGCELHNAEIKGNNTVKMIDLAFTILKLYRPDIMKVRLIDDSGFTWRDGRGKPYKINFLKGYLLLHQKTWYEDKFSANIINEEEKLLYDKRKNNFYDHLKKPEIFNFNNSEVQTLLEPIYNRTNTWKEFIDEFIRLYDSTKYKLMYDWYRNAIYIIFDNNEINLRWEIDISKRPNITYSIKKNGGRRKTNRSGIVRKSYNLNKKFEKYIHFLPHSHHSE